jgi:hypothetical protein
MYSRNYFSPSGRLSLPAAACLVAVGMVLLIAKSEALAQNCKPVNGQLASHFTSPTTISGTVIGGLQADFDVSLTSQTFLSTVDPVPLPPEAAAVAFVTGRTAFQTKQGNILYGVNAAAADFNPSDDGHVTDFITFTGGTGDLAGAFGHIVIVGYIDSATGTIGAKYSGELCTSDND